MKKLSFITLLLLFLFSSCQTEKIKRELIEESNLKSLCVPFDSIPKDFRYSGFKSYRMVHAYHFYTNGKDTLITSN